MAKAVVKRDYFGYPILREERPLTLARIPIHSDRLEDSVIVHPRYVPSGVEHELLTTRVYRRGRSLDFFLDEPIVVDGEEYGILNFKGVGRDARRNLVINPDRWYSWVFVTTGLFKKGWKPREQVDPYDRIWGAVRPQKAQREYPAKVFKEYDFRYAPHIQLNSVPQKIAAQIRKVEKAKERHQYVQLVRALKTNIRIDDPERNGVIQHVKTPFFCRDAPERLAEIDTSVINAQLQLAERGKMIRLTGCIPDNRYIDGLFTDAENYVIDRFEHSSSEYLIKGIIQSSQDVLSPNFLRAEEEYFAKMETLIEGSPAITRDNWGKVLDTLLREKSQAKFRQRQRRKKRFSQSLRL